MRDRESLTIISVEFIFFLFRTLIQELADYEKMPDGPKISAETLEKDGFGEQQFFKCLVAELDSSVSSELATGAEIKS